MDRFLGAVPGMDCCIGGLVIFLSSSRRRNLRVSKLFHPTIHRLPNNNLRDVKHLKY